MWLRKGYNHMSTNINKFWYLVIESAQFGLFLAFIVFLLSQGQLLAAVGWLFAAFGFYATKKEHGFYKEIYNAYSEHLDKCEKRDAEYQKTIREYEEKLSNERNATKESAFDVEGMSIDDILKIGRDFQKSDTWRGATHDTAKLLCDTIEMLQSKLNKRGNRNCDVYDTLDAAMAACYKDREYCSYASAERKSVISFMLQDVKDNSFNKNNDTKKDSE